MTRVQRRTRNTATKKDNRKTITRRRAGAPQTDRKKEVVSELPQVNLPAKGGRAGHIRKKMQPKGDS